MAPAFPPPSLYPASESVTLPSLARVGHGSVEGDVQVPLVTLSGAALEVWPADGPLSAGEADGWRWRSDGARLFFARSTDADDIEAAAHDLYRSLMAMLSALGMPCPLRLWNFFPGINRGAGDRERYRLFVRGRARATDGAFPHGYPSATAIGSDAGSLLVYGFAAARPARPLENPRQVPAWRYPRRYGPVAPGFARAALVGDGTLLISGTASVIGHASTHAGDVLAQFNEARANLDALCAEAEQHFGCGDLQGLKVYLRRAGDAALLAEHLSGHRPCLLLRGDICREELLVELEGVWAPRRRVAVQ